MDTSTSPENTKPLPAPALAVEPLLLSNGPNDIDSGSDNGEKPVRQRLEKTTIAKSKDSDTATPDPQEVDMVEDHNVSSSTRANQAKKRLLDEPTAEEVEEEAQKDPTTPSYGEHARKRFSTNRDKHAVLSTSEEDLTKNDAVEAEETARSVDMAATPRSDAAAGDEMDISLKSPRKKRSRDLSDRDEEKTEDPEEEGRRKLVTTEETRARRSSEERRPDLVELEGTTDTKDTAGAGSTANGHVAFPDKAPQSTFLSTAKIQPSSGFSNSSSISPFGAFGRAASPGKKEIQSELPQTSSSAFAASGFASMAGSASPFGALGSSSSSKNTSMGGGSGPQMAKSPFGALADKTATTQTSSSSSGFAATGFVAASKPSAFGSFTGGSSGGAVFGSGFKGGTSSTIVGGGSKLSSFAAPVGDAKLTSDTKEKPFGAASDSEDEGSTATDDGDDGVPLEEQADTATSANAPVNQGNETKSPNSKLQIHETDTGEENEDTVFLQRGRLYQFQTDKSLWSERGRGIFKINVARTSHETSVTDNSEAQTGKENDDEENSNEQDEETGNHSASDEDNEETQKPPRENKNGAAAEEDADSATQKSDKKGYDSAKEAEEGRTSKPKQNTVSARFIMRAAQIHKVVLNAQIFKGMMIGDLKGNCPTGKTIGFAVFVDGKLGPYQLKLGKEEEVKNLYRIVKDLQSKM